MTLLALTLFLATAATVLQAADARLPTIRRGKVTPPWFIDPFKCNPVPRPNIFLSDAFQPIRKPEEVWPDEDGITRVQMLYDLVDYGGPSYNVITRAYNGDAPGPTLHVKPGGKMEIEFINCLHFPVGSEVRNQYQHPNSTK